MFSIILYLQSDILPLKPTMINALNSALNFAGFVWILDYPSSLDQKLDSVEHRLWSFPPNCLFISLPYSICY